MLVDEAAAVRLDVCGFVVIRDLLSDADIRRLVDLHKSISLDWVKGQWIYSTNNVSDPEQIRQTRTSILDVLRSRLATHFDDITVNGAAFIVKAGGTEKWLLPHQDRSYVDETRSRTATLWSPLVASDEHNGGLGLIQGSHKFFEQVRCAPSFVNVARLPFAGLEQELIPYLIVPSLRAGDAIVFDSALIHASTPNRTDEDRIAISLGIAPEAPTYHYNFVPGSSPMAYRQLEVDHRFWEQFPEATLVEMYQRGEEPHGFPELGLFEHQPVEPTDLATLRRLIEAARENERRLVQ